MTVESGPAGDHAVPVRLEFNKAVGAKAIGPTMAKDSTDGVIQPILFLGGARSERGPRVGSVGTAVGMSISDTGNAEA